MKIENLDQCLDALMKTKSPDFDAFLKLPENDSSYHHSIGQSIRNGFNLWHDSSLKQYFNSIGIYHPDDMSAIIFKSLHRKLNGKPIDLEGQVKYYQDYWKKAGVNFD